MKDSQTRYSRVPGALSTRVEEDAILLPVGSNAFYRLDAIGCRIWDLLEQPRSLVEIRDLLVLEYEVAQKQCEADVRQLLDDLIDARLVQTLES